jgi:hypothetical protein
MLTKLGLMAMTATIGTAAVGGTASAHEPRNDNNTRVERGYNDQVDARVDTRMQPVDGRWDHTDGRFGVREGEFGRRRAYEQMMRERQRRAWEHARWLHSHGGYGNRGW